MNTNSWRFAVFFARRMAALLGICMWIYDMGGSWRVLPSTWDAESRGLVPRGHIPHMGRSIRLVVGRINGEICTW